MRLRTPPFSFSRRRQRDDSDRKEKKKNLRIDENDNEEKTCPFRHRHWPSFTDRPTNREVSFDKEHQFDWPNEKFFKKTIFFRKLFSSIKIQNEIFIENSSSKDVATKQWRLLIILCRAELLCCAFFNMMNFIIELKKKRKINSIVGLEQLQLIGSELLGIVFMLNTKFSHDFQYLRQIFFKLLFTNEFAMIFER